MKKGFKYAEPRRKDWIEKASKNSGISRRGNPVWNSGLTGERYISHYENGVKGGRPKGYHHTEETKKKCSQSRFAFIKRTGWKPKPTEVMKKSAREQMIRNRADIPFNQKMFDSLKRSITRPHQTVKRILCSMGINTVTNFAYRFGNRIGSIDEADVTRKIAIYVDGNYWHNYPDGRRWDRYCNVYLQNRGWKVLRIWEHEIKESPEKVTKNIFGLWNNATS